MKTNIALICLLDNYSRIISKMLGDKLEMFSVDVEEMAQFELGDEKHILDALGSNEGQKLIDDCETKVVKNVTGFENTIININPTTMFSNDNFKEIVKTCYVVYLQISPKFFEQRCKYSGDYIDFELLGIGFTDRDKSYVEKSDIVLNCSTLKEQKAANKLAKVINKFLKKKAREIKHN